MIVTLSPILKFFVIVRFLRFAVSVRLLDYLSISSDHLLSIQQIPQNRNLFENLLVSYMVLRVFHFLEAPVRAASFVPGWIDNALPLQLHSLHPTCFAKSHSSNKNESDWPPQNGHGSRTMDCIAALLARFSVCSMIFLATFFKLLLPIKRVDGRLNSQGQTRSPVGQCCHYTLNCCLVALFAFNYNFVVYCEDYLVPSTVE